MIKASEKHIHYRWLMLLAMIYLVGWMATYPMIYKMTEIHHLLEPGCIYLFPLSYAIADIISEVYGYQVARQVIWFTFIAGFVFCLALWSVSHMPAPAFWHHQQAYLTVFSPILRAYISTTTASLVGNFINIYLISRWKLLIHGRFFWARSLASTGLGELTFSLLGVWCLMWVLSLGLKLFF